MRLLRNALASLSIAWAVASLHAADRPNIVFILADDLGWTDLSCQGSAFYETPNIDRLAQQGLKFEEFYMSQNCAPTRACLMSGQYAPRTGLYTVNTFERGRAEDRKMHVPKNETKLTLGVETVADVLKSAGYATGMFGKWHLGSDERHHPSARGFDEAIRSNGRHFKIRTDPDANVPDNEYLADWITDRGVDFIQRHRSEKFFLYLPHFAVHSPYHAKQEYIEAWNKKKPVGGHRDPTYAAMIQSVDESVGRVMNTLDRLNIAGNTVLIFSSDNGGIGGYYASEAPANKRGITDNAPLRGGKGTLYEGGIRVAFIVRWPNAIEPKSSTSSPGIHVDILPTFAELSNARLPDQPLDGVSLVPIFRNPHLSHPRGPVYHHFPGYLESYVHKTGWRTGPVSVIRNGEWKLMRFYETDHVELYNITHDIAERNDLSQELPDEVERLQRNLTQWLTSLNAAMPVRKSND